MEATFTNLVAMQQSACQRFSDRPLFGTKIANQYKLFCIENDIEMVSPIEYSKSNYWLNAIIMSNFKDRNYLLNALNDANIFSRPIWKLLSTLEMFKDCENDGLLNSKWLEKRVINLPSSVPNI